MAATARHVLYVCHSSITSGAEMSLLALLRALDPERYRPFALVGELGDYVELLSDHGIPVRGVPLPLAAWRDPLGLVRTTRTIARECRRSGASLLHANTFHAIKQAAPFAAFSGVPLVGSVREMVPYPFLTARALSTCRRIVCVSEATRSHVAGFVAKRHRDRLTVIHNGVDGNAFRPDSDGVSERAALGLADMARPIFAMLAPLVRWKGQTLFLEAALRVLSSGTPASFVLVGDDRYAGPGFVQELREIAARPALAGSVRFLGFKKDVAAVLAAIDVLVCASIEPDPFPRAVIESLTAGRPVIAPDEGGAHEAVQDHVNGLLFRARSVESLAEAMKRLACDAEERLRMGRAASDYSRRELSCARHASRMMALYDQVLGTRDASA